MGERESDRQKAERKKQIRKKTKEGLLYLQFPYIYSTDGKMSQNSFSLVIKVETLALFGDNEE